MIVDLGNEKPTRTDGRAPVVTRVTIPDSYTYTVADSAADLAAAVKAEQADALVNRDGITRLPDQEAILIVQAGWRAEAQGGTVPTWVVSDNDDFAVLVSHFFGGIPIGYPDDLEDTYHTLAGEPGANNRPWALNAASPEEGTA